jgi:hypothetical protein
MSSHVPSEVAVASELPSPPKSKLNDSDNKYDWVINDNNDYCSVPSNIISETITSDELSTTTPTIQNSNNNNNNTVEIQHSTIRIVNI